MIEISGEGGSAWLTPPLGGINSGLKERERSFRVRLSVVRVLGLVLGLVLSLVKCVVLNT